MSNYKSLLNVYYNWPGDSNLSPWSLVNKSWHGIKSLGLRLWPLYSCLLMFIILNIYVLDLINLDLSVHGLLSFMLEILLFYLFFSYTIQLTTTLIIGENIQKSWQLYFAKFFTLLGSSILVSFIVTIGSLIVLPAIYFIVTSFLFIPNILLTKIGVVDSIKESFTLIKGNWWLGLKTFGSPLLMLFLLVSLLVRMPINQDMLIFLITIIYPFIMIFFIFMYINFYIGAKINHAR